MEFLEGQTLRQRISGRPLPLEQIVELGIEIADALINALLKVVPAYKHLLGGLRSVP